MIKTISILKHELNQYSDINSKISTRVSNGELTPIIRGLYETDRFLPGYCLASIIYGPSYLSFEFALSYYGLIPETVYHFTSASFNKQRRKKYKTFFGVFTYRDVPRKVFPLATHLFQENGYSFKLAKAEKAICDLLYTVEPCSNQKELITLLFEFFRIDTTLFNNLDQKLMIELSIYYQSKNLRLLATYLKKEIKNRGNNTTTND